MPSSSSKQKGFFQIANAIKAGKIPKGINPSVIKKARKVAENLSGKKIKEFLKINPSEVLNG